MKKKQSWGTGRVLSALLPLALAFAMTPVAAFATPTSATDVADSEVTITGLLDGDMVSAYLIADADIDATNNLSYTFATNVPAPYNTVDGLTAIASDGNSFTQGTDMQNAAAAIANAIATGSATASATASGTSATLTLGSGYYLVRVTSTSGETRVYQNMVVDVSPKAAAGTYAPADDQTLDVKKTDVTVIKTVGANYEPKTDAYSVGDVVPFKVETVIPNYPADSLNATFVIGDKPTAGLKIDTASIAVASADTAGYTLTSTTDGYTITFEKDYILAHPGESITVTYNATLTSDAFSHSATDVTGNTAEVTFNPNPYSNTTVTPDSTTTVQTYGYVFKKVDAAGEPLANATFTITLGNGTVLASTSDANGYVWFEDLAAGTYTAKETTVPAGHLKAPDQTFTLSSTTATADNPATTDVTENNYLVAAENVVDPDQPKLPVTGGAGTLALTLAGVALVGGSLFVICRLARKKNEQL